MILGVGPPVPAVEYPLVAKALRGAAYREELAGARRQGLSAAREQHLAGGNAQDSAGVGGHRGRQRSMNDQRLDLAGGQRL